jgi:hypothetical protein
MASRKDEIMSQPQLKETVTALTLFPAEASASRLGRKEARCASISPPNSEDLIPYSAKELKYLWTMWDEAQSYQPGLRYRNLYAGAVGVILAGWLIQGLGLSFSKPCGGILMLSGAWFGAWCCLKSLRHQRRSAPGR